MAEVRQLTVRGRYENIPTITHFVGEAARAAGLDEKSTYNCQLAADEACTNVIEHAYGAEDIGDIEITCTIEPGVCTIQIVDSGRPFDPNNVPPPEIGSNLDDIQPGGIGLYLMRKLMDRVQFEFNRAGNKLVMVKSRPPDSKAEEATMFPTHEAEAGIWIVSPYGRLDAASAPMLEETLQSLLKRGLIWLAVDMKLVSYISSRGLKAFVSAWRSAHNAGGDIVLYATAPRVHSTFETIGFTQIFDIYDDLEGALTAIRSRKAGSSTPKS